MRENIINVVGRVSDYDIIKFIYYDGTTLYRLDYREPLRNEVRSVFYDYIIEAKRHIYEMEESLPEYLFYSNELLQW